MWLRSGNRRETIALFRLGDKNDGCLLPTSRGGDREAVEGFMKSHMRQEAPRHLPMEWEETVIHSLGNSACSAFVLAVL
ncbi:hypothetical protein BREVUG8_100385 [Brevundimonas sp. G8]|nr:hypothetical protein BREVUG8_100385 [Brevundimonas sp. G8]